MTVAAGRSRMFINGQSIDSSSGATTPVINPATEEVIAEVPEGTPEDADAAVEAASMAFEGGWLDSTPAERSGMLHKLADALEANAEELSRIESQNVGKPKSVSDFDVEFSVDNLRFFA